MKEAMNLKGETVKLVFGSKDEIDEQIKLLEGCNYLNEQYEYLENPSEDQLTHLFKRKDVKYFGCWSVGVFRDLADLHKLIRIANKHRKKVYFSYENFISNKKHNLQDVVFQLMIYYSSRKEESA